MTSNVNRSVGALISRLADADFSKDTIAPKEGGIAFKKKKQSLLSGPSFDAKEFDNALDSLNKLVESYPDIFAKNSSQVAVIAEKLYKETTHIKGTMQAYQAQEKISKLVFGIVLNKWNKSDKNLTEVLKEAKLNLGSSWEAIIVSEMDKGEKKIEGVEGSKDRAPDEDYFVLQDRLALSVGFFKNKNEKEIRKKITSLLNKPYIKEVQIQGFPPLSRELVEKFLQESKGLTFQQFNEMFKKEFTVENQSEEKVISPHLVFKSNFFLENYKTDNTLRLPISDKRINPSIVKLLNKHAENFDTLEINEKNWKKLMKAAKEFEIPELDKKLDQYLSIYLVKEYEAEKTEDKFDFVKDWHFESGARNLPLVKKFCEEKIQECLKNEGANFKNVRKMLKDLYFNQNKLTTLDLSFLPRWTTKNNILVIDMLKFSPHLTSLRLSHVNQVIIPELGKLKNLESLSLEDSWVDDRLGPEIVKLKKLKVLDLSTTTKPTGHLWLTMTDKFVSDLESHPSLEVLILPEANKLVNPEFSNIPHLKKLNLGKSQIESVKLSNLPNLSELDLTNSYDLGIVDLDNTNTLEVLDLSHCQNLSQVLNLGKQAKLEELDLSRSKVTEQVGSEVEELKKSEKFHVKT